MEKANFWSPYIAGVGLGLTLLAAFYIMGRGLGASSAFSIAAATTTKSIAPNYAGGLAYFSQYFKGGSPLKDWMVFEIAGLFLGALVGAAVSGNFRMRVDRGADVSVPIRFLTALSGGVLIGFASRLARGCTSGVALTGGAQLAASGWIFVAAMFLGGFIFAPLMRRLWS